MKKQILFNLVMIFVIVGMFGVMSAGEGSATVPISTIDLNEEGDNYNMKPGRLKFEFDEKLYAIQVRRVKQEYVWFLVMTLDMDNLDDISAYTIDDSFNLSIGETKEIDLNKNNINDISIELNDIISTGKYNSIMSADFSIKKINTKKSETLLNNENENMEIINSNEIIEGEIQEPMSEPVIVLDQEPQEQLTFLEKIINWFKKLFK